MQGITNGDNMSSVFIFSVFMSSVFMSSVIMSSVFLAQLHKYSLNCPKGRLASEAVRSTRGPVID